MYLLTAMTEDRLREAVERPARTAGLKIEPGLTDLLIREVEREPGALPLLSHALQETWHRREGSMLTVDGYRDSGGIRSAVAHSAETVYGRLAVQEGRDQLQAAAATLAGHQRRCLTPAVAPPSLDERLDPGRCRDLSAVAEPQVGRAAIQAGHLLTGLCAVRTSL